MRPPSPAGETVDPSVRGTFVSWIPFHGRSQGISEALGLTPIYACYFGIERPGLAPLKYGPQALRTLAALSAARSNLVFVMNPPVFAIAAVYLYCIATGARFVMDCHSGVFRSPKWRWSLPLQRFFGRRAAAVIVTNPVHLDAVAAWPAKAVMMADAPPPGGMGPACEPADGVPTIFVVVRFGKDEAIGEILEAAARLPSVRFLVSGDVRRARPEWVNGPPANVHYTGFLPLDQFWDCLRRANAVLTLTTEEDTILRGGWEAMFAGQPLITSNTRALKGYFKGGTVFVDNHPEGIAAGVRAALDDEADLRRQMERLRRDEQAAWHSQRRELEQRLGVRLAPASAPA